MNDRRPASASAPPLYGGVLAGGASRRMGSPKEALLLSDGRPMIRAAMDALASACAGRVAVAGACAGFASWPWPDVVRLDDLRPGMGPLAGVEAFLSSRLSSAWIVAACDQPLLAPEALRPLAEIACCGVGAFYRVEGAIQPFPGLWPARWLPSIRRALDNGRLSVVRLLESMPVGEIVWLGSPTQVRLALRDADTPEDLAAIR